MKLTITKLLPLAAALSVAFIIPDQEVMSQIAIEGRQASVIEKLPTKDQVIKGFKSTVEKITESSKNAIDQAIELAADTSREFGQKIGAEGFDAEAWLESEYKSNDQDHRELPWHGPPEHEPHHGPPRHGPPHHGPPHHGPPHHGPPHHWPPHHGHGKPNLTIYQLISKSEYTTKLASIIDEYPDIVTLLNGTNTNYTVFVPIDRAFEHIPKDASKEDIKKFLLYHVSPDFYPAGRVLVSHTIPTAYNEETLGNQPQRLSLNIGLRGLTVNFYSRIIAIDIFGTNGVIHAIDSVLIPPPNAVDILGFLPGEFSTLELGLVKTGLIDTLNDTSKHIGGTLFAPSNFAFQLLGPKINAFLFSSYGLKYLKGLLKYHVVPDKTLYSDAYYQAGNPSKADVPKGIFHVDLPTLLEDKALSIDIFRYGTIIIIKINGFSTVTITDGVARDGVIHVTSSILIPPKSLDGILQEWQGEELTVEEFKARLEPFVSREDL